MDVDRETKETILDGVREQLESDEDGVEAFHVTAAHADGVEYMVSTARSPERSSEALLECLAADVTAVARLLDEDPTAVAESAGRMAVEKDSVGERWDNHTG